MTIKVKRTGLPAELEAAVAVHAAAIVASDDRGATAFVEERAAVAAAAVIERAAAIGPLESYEVIARARLGFHYIVKLRLTGAGMMMTLQNRWHREHCGTWRLIEIEDAGLQSLWKNPNERVVGEPGHNKADAVKSDTVKEEKVDG